MTGPIRQLAEYALDILRRIRANPVLTGAMRYAGLTVTVKVGAFAKEAVVAAVFGVSGAMDVYLMALVIIGFPSAAVVNPVQTVYIRNFVLVREKQGEDDANRLLIGAVSVLLVLQAAVLVLWLAFLPHIVATVAHGFSPEQRSLVADSVRALGFYYFLTGTNAMGYGTLQARKDFAPSALVPIAVPIVTLVTVLSIGADLRALILGLTLGASAETVLVYRRLAAAGLRISWRRIRQIDLDSLRHLVKGSALLSPTWVMTSFSPVIEQSIASSLGSGVVSSLGYAARLPTMITNILVPAVGFTVLPHFTEMLASQRSDYLRHLFVRYAALLAVVGSAIAAVAWLVSEPIVRIAFQRGAFTVQNTAVVSQLLQAYLLQVPGALVGILSTRMLIACGALRAVTTAYVVLVPVVGLAQWGLSRLWGAVGIAYGTSLGVTLAALFLTAAALLVSRKL